MELYHHGIKNQHWGVRNGPPYPLDSKTSSNIKKGNNETLKDDKKVGISHYGSVLGNRYRYPSSMTFEQALSEGKKWVDNESNLSEVIYDKRTNATLNILELPEIENLMDNNFKKGEQLVKLDQDTKNDIRKNGFKNNIELLEQINTDEEKDEYGSTMNNCSKCSDAVELVMRGLDPKLISAGRSQYGMLTTATEYHWDGAIPYKEKSLDNIEKRINSFGNNGSGVISVRRSDGSGHAMHFSKLKDGSIEVQDGQIGKTYSSISDALSAEGHDFNQFCKITRLDCATPNTKHMAEDSVLRIDTTAASIMGNDISPGVKRGKETWWNDNGTAPFTEWGKKK